MNIIDFSPDQIVAIASLTPGQIDVIKTSPMILKFSPEQIKALSSFQPDQLQAMFGSAQGSTQPSAKVSSSTGEPSITMIRNIVEYTNAINQSDSQFGVSSRQLTINGYTEEYMTKTFAKLAPITLALGPTNKTDAARIVIVPCKSRFIALCGKDFIKILYEISQEIPEFKEAYTRIAITQETTIARSVDFVFSCYGYIIPTLDDITRHYGNAYGSRRDEVATRICSKTQRLHQAYIDKAF